MCQQGNTVGGKFEELRDIIQAVNDRSRVGVCLDTCHVFAAGIYMLRLTQSYTVDAYLKSMRQYMSQVFFTLCLYVGLIKHAFENVSKKHFSILRFNTVDMGLVLLFYSFYLSIWHMGCIGPMPPGAPV